MGSDATGAQQTITGSVSKYTAEAHRALIAMRCAVNKRPFHSVADPLYIEEVKLLRPDVKVPSPRTVSREINTIYTEASQNVKAYFEVRCFARMQLITPNSRHVVVETCRLNSPCHSKRMKKIISPALTPLKPTSIPRVYQRLSSMLQVEFCNIG